MAEAFDAYYEVLGIPPAEQPPHLYRLLGVSLFESNPGVISNAAERQMRYMRTLGGGEHSEVSQKILNELAAAKLTLIDANRRAAYDAQLRLKLGASTKAEVGQKQPPEPSRASDPIRRTAARLSPEQAQAADARAAGDSGHERRAGRSWVIGSSSGCDIILSSPAVSRMHCRLTEAPDGFWLDDLKSRNGTFVNEKRLTTKTKVSRDDTVTLGKKVPLPWPSPEIPGTPQHIVMIGRAPENHIKFDHSTVSWFHARIIISGGHAILEDRGSSNGIAVNKTNHRVASCILKPGETVFLGELAVPADDLLSAIEPYRSQSQTSSPSTP